MGARVDERSSGGLAEVDTLSDSVTFGGASALDLPLFLVSVSHWCGERSYVGLRFNQPPRFGTNKLFWTLLREFRVNTSGSVMLSLAFELYVLRNRRPTNYVEQIN